MYRSISDGEYRDWADGVSGDEDMAAFHDEPHGTFWQVVRRIGISFGILILVVLSFAVLGPLWGHVEKFGNGIARASFTTVIWALVVYAVITLVRKVSR